MGQHREKGWKRMGAVLLPCLPSQLRDLNQTGCWQAPRFFLFLPGHQFRGTNHPVAQDFLSFSAVSLAPWGFKSSF